MPSTHRPPFCKGKSDGQCKSQKLGGAAHVFTYLAHVILTVVVVHRAIVARKPERTLARVVRGVIDALGPVVTRVEVFRTELDLRLTIIACANGTRY